MRKILYFLLVLPILIYATACAPKEEPAASTASASVPTFELTPALTPAPTEQVNRSLTTGLETDKEYAPIAIMVENSPKARPQTGLMEADIVYELVAEGGITRFLCIFNDHYPITVGPIRSTRLYYLYLQREWDAPIVHYGGPSDKSKPSYVYSSEFNDIKLRIDGLKNAKYTKYFWRSSERTAPNNVYTNLQTIKEEIYNYTPDERTQFTFDENIDYANGQTFTKVGLPFLSAGANHTTFTFDQTTGKLMRAHSGKDFEIRTVTEDQDGEKKTDASKMSVQNLVVQYVKTYTLENDVKGRRMVEVVGQGDCDYFIGGKHVKGTWKRESMDSSTNYYLEDGSPVTLRPGNTWIAMQPNTHTITVE